MKTGFMTGKEFKAYLESELIFERPVETQWRLGTRASGMELVFNALAEPGQRLVSVKVNGRDVEDAQRYRIAGCEREGEPLDMICRHPGTHDVVLLQRQSRRCGLSQGASGHRAAAGKREIGPSTCRPSYSARTPCLPAAT